MSLGEHVIGCATGLKLASDANGLALFRSICFEKAGLTMFTRDFHVVTLAQGVDFDG